MGNEKSKFTNKRGAELRPTPQTPVAPRVPAGSKLQWTAMIRWWGMFWGIAGPLSTAISLWTYFGPSVAISPGVNLDPSQEFQTQFVVANKGNFPLYNVHFSCEIMGSSADIKDLEINGRTLRRIEKFQSGGVASRGCFTQSRIPTGGRLKVDVYYTWRMGFGREEVQSAYFRVESGASGNYLVPDDSADSSNHHSLIRFSG
ncbi:hypothetical protein [Burkholderia sp. Bp9015]|uniref:hypothetical protein n=1 Tax=Burkholderia sp. Bp9015 TaxID=2184563 RepID=UPI000F5B49E7|nr:hypothetical protein [Burkholderia sp. Bp9015]